MQRVRRFPKGALLRGLARVAARETRFRNHPDRSRKEKEMSFVREGYVFQVAGICLRYCNNHRRAFVDDRAIDDLAERCWSIWPPELDGTPGDEEWHKVLSRLAYIQMPVQLSRLEPLARSICLFGTDPRFGRPVLDRGWWEETTGVTLSQFLKIAFVMSAVPVMFGGSIPRRRLLDADLGPVFQPVEPARTVRVIDRWLASPLDHLTQIPRDQTATPGDLWTFNPLYERPIVIMKDDTYVIPSPRTVLQRIAPQGLYFLARDAMDADQNPNDFRGFTAKLGLRYQTYIGEQLRLLKHARVHSEITYGSSQQSVDYIIETSEVLVLVEVKSVAPDIWTRSGVFPDGGDVDRKINRACQQITRTAELILRNHPDLPKLEGRPMRGLVITREDYFNLSLYPVTEVATPAAIPTTVVSSQQLEFVVSGLSDDLACGSSLLGALASDTNRIKTDLDPLPVDINPLVEEVVKQWARKHGLSETASVSDHFTEQVEERSHLRNRPWGCVDGLWLQ